MSGPSAEPGSIAGSTKLQVGKVNVPVRVGRFGAAVVLHVPAEFGVLGIGMPPVRNTSAGKNQILLNQVQCSAKVIVHVRGVANAALCVRRIFESKQRRSKNHYGDSDGDKKFEE